MSKNSKIQKVTLICPKCNKKHIDLNYEVHINNDINKPKMNFYKTPHRLHYCNYCNSIFKHPKNIKCVSVDGSKNLIIGILIN
jgi:hypothetical protein